MHVESVSYRLRYTLRWSTNVNDGLLCNNISDLNIIWFLLWFMMRLLQNSMLIIVLSWDPSNLVNVWWTTWPTTFSTTAWNVWDSAFWVWSGTSCNKQIYHACTRNKALTQPPIDADIALWTQLSQIHQ